MGGCAQLHRRLRQTLKGDALITPAIAPHAPYTVSPEHLKAVKAFAEERDVPILTHLAEPLPRRRS